MSNKKRSTKRQVRVPVKFNDHVVRNLSQKRIDNCAEELNEQIRVLDEDPNVKGGMDENDAVKEVVGTDGTYDVVDKLGTDSNGNKVQEGMNNVVEMSPWMVNGKPLMVQKWNPDIGMEKTEHDKISLWVKFTNVPMEAWGVEGLIVVASSVGKPIIMDYMTAKVCKTRTGRTEYARILIEISVEKGFKENVELQYRDKHNNVKGTKMVKVEYNWNPHICSHCVVFGHNWNQCTKRVRTSDEINVGMKPKLYENKSGSSNMEYQKKQWTKKKPNVESMGGNGKEKSFDEEFPKLPVKNTKERSTESLLGNERMKNKYSVLSDVESDNMEEIKMLKDRMIVDEAWEAYKEKERLDQEAGMEKIVEGIVEDMLKDDSLATQNLVCDKAFGRWEWFLIDMLCLIENMYDKKRVYCSFVYAANTNCTNSLEIEDICSSRLFYTWIKSPHYPQSSVLKKLDRFMVNEGFLKTYDQAYAVFHPYIISDHSPAVLTIPKAMKRKPKAFRFTNFITEKPEFLDIVREDVFRRVVHLKKKLQDSQTLVDSQPHNTQFKEAVVVILKEYHEAVINEEKLLFQKAKVENMVEGDDVAKQFVEHYKEFLGHEKQVDDISSMQGIFTKTLSVEEALYMVREVTNNEIKTAMFDIRDNKASGPDGYTSRFFKKAWHIVGEDVCKAIKEFFESGKLLGEINATIITLVLKIVHAKTVGRQIQDNIIIAQELLKGYNRNSGPKRYSLKIDIAKAYDTVNWEFLKEILILFGFHEKMVHWIVTCVTSTSFSICVNGDIHRITNLCFADDLLVLCHGDVVSVEVIKQSLNDFSRVFGLILNMNKVGKLPVKYLGVLLITKRLGMGDCKQLLDKVKMKVRNWKNKYLSYAGRLQLVAAVLSSMKLFCASVFLVPKGTVKDIGRVFKGFFWCQGELTKGKAKVAWKTVCQPKHQGGLGLKDLGEDAAFVGIGFGNGIGNVIKLKCSVRWNKYALGWTQFDVSENLDKSVPIRSTWSCDGEVKQLSNYGSVGRKISERISIRIIKFDDQINRDDKSGLKSFHVPLNDIDICTTPNSNPMGPFCLVEEKVEGGVGIEGDGGFDGGGVVCEVVFGIGSRLSTGCVVDGVGLVVVFVLL
ncbi:RNA-directed DNA polymerase, eukaryota, reverse transcriptase zinc-binding domain protein [Tanacetum coccineum]